MVSKENMQILRRHFSDASEQELEQLFADIDKKAEAEAYRQIVFNQLKCSCEDCWECIYNDPKGCTKPFDCVENIEGEKNGQ